MYHSVKFRMFTLWMLLLVFAVACKNLKTGVEVKTIGGALRLGPSPGNNGVLTTTNATASSVTLNWALAESKSSKSQNFQYFVCSGSSLANIDTVGECESATQEVNWTENLNSKEFVGLTPSKEYHFNVIVKNSANRKVHYAGVSVLTASDIKSCADQASDFFYGQGTKVDPYRICDTRHFLVFARTASLWNKHFILTSDVDASDLSAPIGIYDSIDIGSAVPFTGSFDGANYSITGLKLSNPSSVTSAFSLFAFIKGAEIKNVTLKSPEVKVTSNYIVSTLVGLAENSRIEGVIIENGLIDRVSVSDSGASQVGFIVGKILDSLATDVSTVTKCKSSGTMNAHDTVAGSIGAVVLAAGSSVEISQIESSGAISAGGNTIAGLLGYVHLSNSSRINLINLRNSANVSVTGAYSGNWSGLLIGTILSTSNGSVTGQYLYNSGHWSGDPTFFVSRGCIGTIIGEFNITSSTGSFSDLGNIGNITIPGVNDFSYNRIGGLFGRVVSASSSVSIQRFYSQSMISIGAALAPWSVSGAIGRVDIATSGTVAISEGYVSVSYTGTAPSSNSLGGILGTANAALNGPFLSVANTFYNIDLISDSGNTDGVVNGSIAGIMQGAPATSLRSSSTFSTFDFNTIWSIQEGSQFPLLRGLN